MSFNLKYLLSLEAKLLPARENDFYQVDKIVARVIEIRILAAQKYFQTILPGRALQYSSS